LAAEQIKSRTETGLYRKYCIDKRLAQRVCIDGREPESRDGFDKGKRGEQNGSSENKHHGDLS
jgi:hypothetical protein